MVGQAEAMTGGDNPRFPVTNLPREGLRAVALDENFYCARGHMPILAGQRGSGRRGLSESFKKLVRQAGLDLQTVKGAGNQMFSRRTFHALRHSFTSALANQNVASELRMALTGPKTEGEHRKYTDQEMDNLRAAIQKLPSLR